MASRTLKLEQRDGIPHNAIAHPPLAPRTHRTCRPHLVPALVAPPRPHHPVTIDRVLSIAIRLALLLVFFLVALALLDGHTIHIQ